MTDQDRTIEAHHIATDLKVADLTSVEWDKAQPVQINRYWSGESAPVARQADARILWSNKALHLRFICQQREPLVVSDKPQTEKKTMGLWDRDVCEIFIAPDENVIERYFEFEAAPTGEWLDVAIHWSPNKRESDWQFRSGMSCAAMRTITKGGESRDLELVWIAMRIPWNHWIHQPQKGERWRVNLFRCVGKDPNRGYLAWQPTKTPQPGFHVPQVFGWLKFG
ncbi:MAG: carbohydrate-binding family 9-like protein [Pyrinomonadaceae bacterium]